MEYSQDADRKHHIFALRMTTALTFIAHRIQPRTLVAVAV